MNHLTIIEIVCLVGMLICVLLLVFALGELNAVSAETEDLRERLIIAEEQKAIVIEQNEAPQDMTAVTEAYTPAVEPEKVDQAPAQSYIKADELLGMTSLGSFRVTHYCTCSKCCGKSDGITASGRAAVPYYTIAVDPSVIPLGTVVYLDYGDGVLHECRADDTGGAINGNVVDLCVGDHTTAVQMGVRSATVYITEGQK